MSRRGVKHAPTLDGGSQPHESIGPLVTTVGAGYGAVILLVAGVRLPRLPRRVAG